MKLTSPLTMLTLLATLTIACVKFEGSIQVGGINHGISIVKFEDNGSKPCQGEAFKNPDGWFRIVCDKGVSLTISPKGDQVKYSHGSAHFEWRQKTKESPGDQIGACDDRRGACITLGKQYDWKTKMYC